MSLELFHVGTVKRVSAVYERAPLRDVLFERSIGKRSHAMHAFIQTPRRDYLQPAIAAAAR